MTIASSRKTHVDSDAPDPEASYGLDDQPGFLLRVALKTHTTVFTANMIDSLTAPQFSTLAKLKEVGPCSQNYLGRLIHYDSATITGVVNRLKNRGLIESIVDPLDRRRVAIDLTEAGRAIANEAIAAVKKISRKTFSPLSPSEHATLTALLKKVILR
ncbi:DNA-binding transcriptional regulator, MarR family [Tardiphaga sp. OK246]|jgi:DNA-binding MarR family transcriptional regulator|nr:DNA-binding transcriptional regulator, MarR family [Tardiphaga sp. OK246]